MYPKKRVMAHNQLIRLKQHLKRGGVCAYPTEYCFGLGGLPKHPKAIKKILHLKKRPAHKGLIVLGGSFTQLRPLLQPLTKKQRDNTKQYWPGANTLVLPASSKILPQLRGYHHKNLAVRVTAHNSSAWLCSQIHSPLISTSANKAKAKPIRNIRTLKKQFGKKVWIINAPLGKNKHSSRIIDLADGKIIRENK